eukprot:m.52388 g.52388  ORF g.52388 m.52388 type:complete len:77 (+) comp12697_c0_seq1:1304-1534(+)
MLVLIKPCLLFAHNRRSLLLFSAFAVCCLAATTFVTYLPLFSWVDLLFATYPLLIACDDDLIVVEFSESLTNKTKP